MFSACTETGIVPNPDISGIGVRAAIYAQAVLTLVQPSLASADGRISEKELTGLHRLYLGILLPGCALLLSAIIQARAFGLSVYHAILVLNLSWINNTSALIFFQFALIAQIGLNGEHNFRSRVGGTLRLLYNMMGSTMSNQEDGNNREVTRNILREKALRLKKILREQEKFPQSQDILDDVVQNLSALVAADRDIPELTETVNMTNNRKRLWKSLGVDVEDSPSKKWWKEMGRRVQTTLEWAFKQFPGGKRVVELLERDWIMASLASAHLTLFAAFGVWVWFTISHFGDCERFTGDTTLVILPRVGIKATSRPLRILSIVMYIICLLPIVNIVLIGALEFVAIYGFRRLLLFLRISRHHHESRALRDFIVLTFFLQAYFIITTEWTIYTNRHLLNDSAQESNWTFGQTLAVALIAIPLVEVMKQSWEERKVLWSIIKQRIPFRPTYSKIAPPTD